MPSFISKWLNKPCSPASIDDALAQLEADLDARLAARKALRSKRSQAARNGHRTRRAHQFNQGSI